MVSPSPQALPSLLLLLLLLTLPLQQKLLTRCNETVLFYTCYEWWEVFEVSAGPPVCENVRCAFWDLQISNVETTQRQHLLFNALKQGQAALADLQKQVS